uniref:SMODS and SLOG-associating 2TM effector domain-containing protein n=1 Tax=Peronospora matthiolae TaxID=2874970 RepID=A0AAV1VBI6_9STRA
MTGRSRAWTKLTALETHQSEAREQLNKPITSDALDESHVRVFRLQVVKRLLGVTIKSWTDVTQEEEKIGPTLYAEATAALLAKNEATRPGGWDWKRHAAIGAASMTGGALLAVTGGLADPAIAASLTALGGAGVTVAGRG